MRNDVVCLPTYFKISSLCLAEFYFISVPLNGLNCMGGCMRGLHAAYFGHLGILRLQKIEMLEKYS